jgi:chemotaxis protein MotB
MARKKKHAEHVNHERWLVSYADFITLLFAFFVVMFAVSQVDSKKVGRFTESFSKAVGIDLFPESGQGLMSGGETETHAVTPDTRSRLPAALIDLQVQLEEKAQHKELPKGLQIVQRRNEIVVRLSENLLFDPGDDTLKSAAERAIEDVARELASRPVDVRVEGHTDDRPIRTVRFRSNWDLSTARATAVVAVLSKSGLAPERLSAAGYGEFHPLGPNKAEDGRRQNRRVDIVVSVTQTEEGSL